jgi:uncharacterized protein (DUF1499 family)
MQEIFEDTEEIIRSHFLNFTDDLEFRLNDN